MSKNDKIITASIFSTLFFSSYTFFSEPFEFYISYFVIVLFLPIFILKYRFPFVVLKIMFPLLLIGIAGVLLGENTWKLFLKIFPNLIISLMFYYYVCESYSFDIKKLFSFYIKGAYIVACIGIFQVICFFLRIHKGYDFSWILNKWSASPGGIIGIRVNSILSEPAYLASALAPAAFIAIYNLIYRKNIFLTKKEGFIILIIYILSSSSLGYIGILIMLILLLINVGLLKNLVLFLPLVIFGYYFIYDYSEGFRERMDGLERLYSGETTDPYKVHGSAYANYNNFHVSWENFKANPFFGTGVGSHPIAFMKYSIAKAYKGQFDSNKMDANSMALRLMSETGLYGLLLMFLFIRKFFVLKEKNNENEIYWVVSSACLLIIFLQLFRQGNYTYNGFMFYLWLYYFTYIEYKNKLLLNEKS